MEVYSKPQIDQIGVKTAEKIKAAKGAIPPITQALGQSTTSATSQKLVTDELAKYYSSLAVQSRGMNLITNGTGLMGNNYNFPNSTFYTKDAYAGKGSFLYSSANTAAFLTELLPVDVNKYYKIEAYLKSIDGAKANNAAFLFASPIDIDGLAIAPIHYINSENTITTLTQPLKIGDTQINVTSNAGWRYPSVSSVSASAVIKIHAYKNTGGFAYGVNTYSRLVSAYNAVTFANVDTNSNVINLNSAWTVANPDDAQGTWPIGTAIGVSHSAGSYMYYSNISNTPITSDWTKGYGIIGGKTPAGTAAASSFPSGTAFIRLGLLANRMLNTSHTYPAVSNKTALSNVYMTEITPENMQGQYQSVYNTTTALGANMVVDVSGNLLRSTSSERYKDILADVELSDELYNDAMQLKPILYRSTADADNPRHHYYSFSAEVMGAFDPAFALWRYTELVDEIVTDADGVEITIQKEVKLDEPVAEGLNINAILALNHAISIKQHKMLAKQADDIAVLTKAIEQLKRDK